jgi:hypothetical protein
MRRSLLAPVLVSAVALAGCTTATSSNDFSGPANDVAKALSDLQSAGQRKDSAKICNQLLAQSFVSKLNADGTSCATEIDKAVKDADEFTLDVRSVKVNGSQATAQVRQGKNGATRSVTLVREANRWKVSGLSPS